MSQPDEPILMTEETTDSALDAALMQANKVAHLVGRFLSGSYSVGAFRRLVNVEGRTLRDLLNAIGYRVRNDGTLVGPDEE